MHTFANTYSSLWVCLHKGIQFLNDRVFIEPLWISCKKKKTQQNKNAVKNRELILTQRFQIPLKTRVYSSRIEECGCNIV